MNEAPTSVLFVEDDVAKRYVVARQLRQSGFEVDEVGTGADALAAVRPTHDVVVLDLQLPDVPGWDVCKAIKASPDTSTVMVLMLSAAFVATADRARGLDLGADAYLVHPVEMIELVATVRALARLRRVIRERDLERELLIATVGHDLRSPLTVFAMGLEVLRASADVGESARSVIDRLDRHAYKMRQMVDQLLVFTQSLAGAIHLERAECDLFQLCQSAVQDFATLDRPVALEGAELRIVGDCHRLGQVVDNLVSNAVRHGTGEVRVSLTRTADRAVLRVQNPGPPIPRESLGVLFEPFKRTKERHGGFGLGLYIVDRVVRAHGGSIDVRSTLEEGTIFEVTLPLGD
jgi:signal transduction histidine kinase